METRVSSNTKVAEALGAPITPDEAGIQAFVALVRTTLESGRDPVTVDCTSLQKVTSSHVNALWQARQLCAERGVRFRLEGVGEGLRRVLEVLDLAEFFLPGAGVRDRKEFIFPPTIDDIDSVMSDFVSFLVRSGVPDVVAFELQTVFYETGTNIRCHGSLAEGDEIRCCIDVQPRGVVLTFVDRGTPFDPTGHNTTTDLKQASREHRRRGFGLTMITRLSTSMEYRRTDNGENQLTIRKTW